MFLNKLRLNKLRSLEDEQICFRKDLTNLAGENNGVRTHDTLPWNLAKFELTDDSERATAMLKPQFRAPWEGWEGI
jgi:hypothetical protein